MLPIFLKDQNIWKNEFLLIFNELKSVVTNSIHFSFAYHSLINTCYLLLKKFNNMYYFRLSKKPMVKLASQSNTNVSHFVASAMAL